MNVFPFVLHKRKDFLVNYFLLEFQPHVLFPATITDHFEGVIQIVNFIDVDSLVEGNHIFFHFVHQINEARECCHSVLVVIAYILAVFLISVKIVFHFFHKFRHFLPVNPLIFCDFYLHIPRQQTQFLNAF